MIQRLFQTPDRKVLALLLCVVLVASFFAQLVSSDFGQVKISDLTIDSRGAELDIDLYVPAGVSDQDSLPCVLLAHGRGATKNVMRGLAEELARMGYVVLNVNAYGMGRSEQPVYDEVGNGQDEFAFGNSPIGMIDALEFARTLKYVDQTRIAMVGHSYGSSRISVAATMDSGYLTVNDKKVDLLYQTFGLEFTEEEICQDADALAAERLDPAQFAHYEDLARELEQESLTSLDTLVLMGSTGGPASATVTLAGHEVTRECQVNVAYINGKYDSLGAGAMWSQDGTQTVLGTSLLMDCWYSSLDQGSGYEELGQLGTVTRGTSQELASALDSRSARIVCYNSESHSKNYFSSASNSDCIAILSQALDHRADEAAPGASLWVLRACLDLVAMLAMLMSVIVLCLMLLHTPFFSPCIAQSGPSAPGFTKGQGLLLAGLTVVLTVLALLKANSGGPTWANPFGTRWFPNILRLVTTSAIGVWFIVWLTVASLVILGVKLAATKKNGGTAPLFKDCLALPPAAIAKTLLLAALAIAFAYLQLMVIVYLFGQDFRFWQTMFTEMKAEHWLVALPYVILFLLCYLVIGSAINYGAGAPEGLGKDMVKTIAINAVGVWGLCLFCYAMWFINWTGAAISDFTLSYSMLLLVPLTVFIMRKMYAVTRRVWLGAALNAMLLAWTLVCSAGIADLYYGQGIVSILFNV